MEENKKSFFQNKRKMEKYLDKLNSNEIKTINHTLEKIKSKIGSLMNVDSNENNEFFINHLSPKLINTILSSNLNSMISVLEFYLNFMVENLEKVKLIPFYNKILKILNKKDQFYYKKEERNVALSLLESKLSNFQIDSNFYKNLEIGFLVDYLYIYYDIDTTKEIALWTRAKIIEINSDLTGKIKLLGNGLFVEAQLNNQRILPVKSLSHDFEWRNNIKCGELVDVFVKNSWNLCKITELSNKTKLANYTIMFLPTNEKTLPQNCIINVFSPLLRRAHQYSKRLINESDIAITEFEKSKINLVETFVEYDEKNEIYFLPCNKDQKIKECFFDMINNMAKKKIFEKMIYILKFSEIEDKISFINFFTDVILLVYKNFYFEFSNKFLNQFLSLTNEILTDYFKQSSFDTEKLIKIFLSIKKLLRFHYSKTDYIRLCYNFSLEFLKFYLSIENRKNEELAKIYDLFENDYLDDKFNSILIEELEKRKIKDVFFKHVFIPNFDINLLLISSKLVNKFFRIQYFKNEIETICNILFETNSIEKFKKEVYLFMTDIAHDIEITKYIINNLIGRIKIEKTEIMLLSTFLNHLRTRNNEENQIEENYDFISSILIHYYFDEKCDKDTRRIIKSNLVKTKEEFILNLPLFLDAINSNSKPINCFSKFRKLYYKHENIELKKLIMEEYKFINIVINNYMKYHEQTINQISVERIEMNDPLYNYIKSNELLLTKHRQIVTEVIKSLTTFLSIYKESLSQKEILINVGFNNLFDIFVKIPIDDNDIFLYANFLSISESDLNFDYISERYKTILIEFSKNQEIFEEKLFDTNYLENLWSLFITTNIYCGSIKKSSNEKELTNRFIFSNNFKDKELICVLCETKDLICLDFYWNHLIRIKEPQKKMRLNEDEITKNFSRFVNLFVFNHEKLVKNVENWKCLIEYIFNSIKEINKKINNKNKNLIIKNLLNILHIFITNTEVIKLGIYSHSSLVTHSIFEIPFNNEITNRYHRTSQFFKRKLKCPSNCTIWDLKVHLGKLFGIIPEIISIDKASNECNIEENGKTVRESFINLEKSNKIIKSRLFSKFPREPLAIDGQCTPKFIKVLTEIFELHSTDNRLSIENFIEFIKTCVDEDIIKYNDKRITTFLDKYDKDKDLLVSLESLIKFYLFNEKEKNEVIWANLYNYNIKNDLKNLDVEYEIYKIDNSLFPRYSIANNEEYFDLLYEFIASETSNLEIVGDILFLLTTNKSVYRRILVLDEFIQTFKDSDFTILTNYWEDYLFSSNPIKFYYNLNIVFSIFTNVLYENEKSEIIRDISYLRLTEKDLIYHNSTYYRKYIDLFVRTGGFNVIINNFLRDWITYNDNFIILILNFLILMMTLFHCSKKEVPNMLEDLKLNFSNLVRIYHNSQFTSKSNQILQTEEYFELIHVENNDSIDDINNLFWQDIYDKYNIHIINNIDIKGLVTTLIQFLIKNNEIKIWTETNSNLFNISLNLLYLLSIEKSFNLQNVLFQDNQIIKELLNLPSGLCKDFNLFYLKFSNLMTKFIENIPNKKELSSLNQITKYLFNEIFNYSKDTISSEITEIYTDILKLHISQEETNFNFKEIFDFIDEYFRKGIYDNKLKCYLNILEVLISLKKLILPKIKKTENISDLIKILDNLIFDNDSSRFKILDDNKVNKSIFNLLNSLIETKEYDLDIIYQTNFSQLPKKAKNIKKNLQYNKEKRSNKYIVVNVNGDFYFNCVVQNLFFMRNFKNIISSIKNVDPEKQKFLYNFQRLFYYMDHSQRNNFDIETDNFFDNRLTILYSDSVNLMKDIIHNLKIDLENTEFKYLIESYFQGKFIYKEECLNCKSKVISIKKFYGLDISITDLTTVKELFEYIEAAYLIEKNSKNNCLTCHNKIVKKKYIYDLPNFLFINFKDSRSTDEKREVTINKELDMKYDINYIYSSKDKYVKTINKETKEEDNIIIYERDDSYYQYELVGVIKSDKNDYDTGYIYVSLNEIPSEMIEILSLSQEKKKPVWIEFYDESAQFIDSRLTKTTWIEQLIKGENVIVDNPLHLVYERKKKNPIKMVKQCSDNFNYKNALIKTVSKNNKNLQKKKFDIFCLDNLNYLSKKDLFFDNTYILNEVTKEITYYTFFENLPNDKEFSELDIFKEEVILDNFNYKVEKMIFGKSFMKFLEKFFKFCKEYCLAYTNIENISQVKKLYKLCLELFYEIPLRNFELDGKFNNMVICLDEIAKLIPKLSIYVIKEILKRKEYFLEASMNFNDNQIKSLFMMISNKIALILENQSDYKEKVLTNVFQLLDDIFEKFCIRLKEEYFIIFEQLIKTNSTILISYLIKKRLISKLLTCVNYSAKILRSALNLIGLLASYCETETWCLDDYKKGIIPKSYLGNGLNNFQLSDIEKYYLYSEVLYLNIIEMAIFSEIKLLLNHLIFNNLEFSKLIISVLYSFFKKKFTRISNSSFDRREFVYLITSLLSLEDNYTTIRIECFFGIPRLKMNNILANSKIIFEYASPINMSIDLDPKKNKIRNYDHHFSEVYENLITNIINQETLFKYLNSIPSISTESSNYIQYLFQLMNEDNEQKRTFVKKDQEKDIILRKEKLFSKYQELVVKLPIIDKFSKNDKVYVLYIKFIPHHILNSLDMFLFDVYYDIRHNDNNLVIINEFNDCINKVEIQKESEFLEDWVSSFDTFISYFRENQDAILFKEIINYDKEIIKNIYPGLRSIFLFNKSSKNQKISFNIKCDAKTPTENIEIPDCLITISGGAHQNIVTYSKLDLTLNWSKLDISATFIDEIFEIEMKKMIQQKRKELIYRDSETNTKECMKCNLINIIIDKNESLCKCWGCKTQIFKKVKEDNKENEI